MDHDVSTLMLGMFGGEDNDEFGADRDTKRPLLLDSVMGGKPCVSGSRLLNIPAEILANIVDFIADDQPTLAALALVNSDCRQLARSCQFVDICFDYSPRAFDLLLALLRETVASVSTASQPTIGACIRRVTVKSDRQWVASTHWELYQSIWGDTHESYNREQKKELHERATKTYNSYRSGLLGAISDAMPHLETIAWCDQVSVGADFLKVISHLSIKRLKLSQVPIDEPYLMEPPLTPAVMQLRSLHLDTRLAWRVSGDVEDENAAPLSLNPFFKSLFLRCAPTLKSLVWPSWDFMQGSEPISLGDEAISFPRLRHLKLPMLKLAPSTLSSFLSVPLRQLALPSFSNCENMEDLLANCEPMSDLQTLVIQPVYNLKAADSLVSFLGKHKDLQKLYIKLSLPAALDPRIIPLLSSGKFSNLLSLSLSWDGPGIEEDTRPHIATIAEESIAAIGRIVSLEQLYLSAGQQAGWRCQWLVDHEILRANFKGLTKLKKLAIDRDTYRTIDELEVEAYYSDKVLRHADWLRAHEALGVNEDLEYDDIPYDEIFERGHRDLMLAEAEKYAATLPSLEWIFCGQWPMAIEEHENGKVRVAVPLTKERDSCWTALNRMFSMETND